MTETLYPHEQLARFVHGAFFPKFLVCLMCVDAGVVAGIAISHERFFAAATWVFLGMFVSAFFLVPDVERQGVEDDLEE